ncbi:vacuolar iron transporter homolog 4-like [Salvia hispanica]|uniref:vacuolar iron transporter homolog 4-like n=1 Tax=Salvia hispanica TaxID=49212 RepID=UPI0020090D8D|nr:vacuolar iron transporter homolog 4-like [Salvia hispanica]
MSNKNIEIELGQNEEALVEAEDYSKREKWLRAAVLGANDGLLSTASLMMEIGAVRRDAKTMLLTGAASLVAGACSMAMGEFVSVYSQLDIEVAQMEREKRGREERSLPSPVQAAAFTVGVGVPLLAAAFARDYRVRLGAVVAAVSVALLGFGWASATLGRAPLVRAALRVLFGGWVAMGITFGLTKLIGYSSKFTLLMTRTYDLLVFFLS